MNPLLGYALKPETKKLSIALTRIAQLASSCVLPWAFSKTGV